jgi:hypothetical protein
VKLLEPPGANAIVVSLAAAAALFAAVVGVRRLAYGRVAAAVDQAR